MEKSKYEALKVLIAKHIEAGQPLKAFRELDQVEYDPHGGERLTDRQYYSLLHIINKALEAQS